VLDPEWPIREVDISTAAERFQAQFPSDGAWVPVVSADNWSVSKRARRSLMAFASGACRGSTGYS
jgi:hypothetical protein